MSVQQNRHEGSRHQGALVCGATDPHAQERVRVRNSVHATISKQLAALSAAMCQIMCFDESCAYGRPPTAVTVVVPSLLLTGEIPLYASWGTFEM